VSDFISSVQATAAASAASRKDEQSLSMDDFFQLMVAQLQNQDMFSPADNTQFINQMAQFSMVNALMDMQELSNVSYGMSLIGKTATVASITDAGQMLTKTGVIEGVNLFNGQTEVVIGGEAFGVANIMSVGDSQSGFYGSAALTENAGLIGMYATVLRATEDGGVETVQGIIDTLRLVDNEVCAYIDGKEFSLKEILSLSERSASEDTGSEDAESEDAQ
jgi:flagellar basal-body rod modification protein FlgD